MIPARVVAGLALTLGLLFGSAVSADDLMPMDTSASIPTC